MLQLCLPKSIMLGVQIIYVCRIPSRWGKSACQACSRSRVFHPQSQSRQHNNIKTSNLFTECHLSMTVYVPTEDLESVRVLPWFFKKKKPGTFFFFFFQWLKTLRNVAIGLLPSCLIRDTMKTITPEGLKHLLLLAAGF